MKNNFSIVQWDVGCSGSFLLCMSDFIRYDIDFDLEKLPKNANAFRTDVLVQFIEDIPYNNEFQSGLFANKQDNWYSNLPGFDTRKKFITDLKNKGVSGHVKMHYLPLNEEEYFSKLLSSYNYKTYIKIQATSPDPFILMHFKRSGRDLLSKDKITEFTIDITRQQTQLPIISRYFDIVTIKDSDIFNNENFKKILQLLSGKDMIPKDILDYGREYNEKNQRILSWMRHHRRNIVSDYNLFYELTIEKFR